MDSDKTAKHRLADALRTMREHRKPGGGGGTGFKWRPAGAAPPARSDITLEQLQQLYAAHHGDVDALVAALGMPPEIASIAAEQAALDPDNRTVEGAIAKAEAVLRAKHPKN